MSLRQKVAAIAEANTAQVQLNTMRTVCRMVNRQIKEGLSPQDIYKELWSLQVEVASRHHAARKRLENLRD